MAGTTDNRHESQAFLGLDDTIGARLREVFPIIDAAIPAILDGFYARVMAHPELRQLVDRHAAVDCLKKRQREHWRHLLQGRFDEEYARRAVAIGEAHHRIGLSPDWYLRGYALLLSELLGHAILGRRCSRRRQAQTVEAVARAVVFDMERVVSVYLDSAEIALEKELRGTADQVEAEIKAANDATTKHGATLHASVDALSDAAARTGDASSTVAAASEEALVSFESVSTRVDELFRAIEGISGQLGRADETRAGDATTAVALIEDLDAHAEEIGDIVDLISDIARRTNLLALNATIEAARAGEAGRGFAVVAQEVQTLAQQTADATQRVSRQIESVQQASRQVCEAIDAVSRSLGEQSGAAAEMRHHLNDARNGNREVVASIQSVAADAREVDRITQGVRGEVDEVRDATRRIVDNVATLLARLRANRAFDRRGEPRVAPEQEMRVTVLAGGRRFGLRVVDLSRTGLAAEGALDAERGARVEVELAGVLRPVPAVVLAYDADRIRFRLDPGPEQTPALKALAAARSGSAA